MEVLEGLNRVCKFEENVLFQEFFLKLTTSDLRELKYSSNDSSSSKFGSGVNIDYPIENP